MVTIKTFAQLLGDRYQDEDFRTRFQEVVGSDIERMDELLEMMIEFADFRQPQPGDLSLDDKLRAIVVELQAECAKRQTQFACEPRAPLIAPEYFECQWTAQCARALR